MDEIPLWSLLPSLAALAIALALQVVARRKKWTDPPEEGEPTPVSAREAESPSTGGDFKKRLEQFVSRRRWELTLAGVVLAIVLYLVLLAPVQMTGKVSIEPNMPGRPFFFLHWQRNTLSVFFGQAGIFCNLLTGLLSLALVIVGILRRSPRKLQSGLLWSLLSLAASGQWYLAVGPQRTYGVLLYLLVVLGFLLWAVLGRERIQKYINQPIPVSRSLEIVLVIIVTALATFSRLYQLPTIPYGIEGDEAKWTAEIVDLGLRGEVDLTGLYHRDALPVSFYMQILFHKLFGPSIFSARLEVAVFSILATLVFYLLLRQLTSIPLALLASWLLSASIFDISASRLANVESHVKLWPILTLALLAWAVHTKHWPIYAISGVALVLGLLTYDTVWPLLIVAILIAVIEIARQPIKVEEKVRQLTALLAPSLLAIPFLAPYFASRISYYQLSDKDWQQGLATLWGYFTEVMSSIYVYTNPDFLYNRFGPLLNAFLLPWLALGFVTAIASIRQRLSYWTLIWGALFIFPVPIAAHSPLGRVYYPGLPAIYVLVAFGMFLFARDSLHILGKVFAPLVITIFAVTLIWLALFNLYIYFNEVTDGADRQMRREIGEIAAQAAGPDNLIVLPSVPHADEPLNNEYQMIELFMLKKIPASQIAASYRYVALGDLLPALPHGLTSRPNLEIILDKTTDNDREKRDALAKALQTCYPEGQLFPGAFFDRFSLNKAALDSPACISADLTLNIDSPRQVSWSLSQGAATGISLKCEMQQVDHTWIEAETLAPSPGWQSETSFASGWSGNGFLMDNYGSQPMQYNYVSSTDQPVYAWVRSYKRAVDNSPGQIAINGQMETFAATDENHLNQWIWERLGPFQVNEGDNNLSLARPYLDDPMHFMALFIDSLVITPAANFQPDQAHYLPLPPIQYHFGLEQNHGQITLDFAPGVYECRAEAETKLMLVDAFGNSPVESNTVLLDIKH